MEGMRARAAATLAACADSTTTGAGGDDTALGWAQLTPLVVTETELPVPPASNGLALVAANLAAVTPDAARIGPAAGPGGYSVQSDGPLEISPGAGRRLRLAAAGQHDGSLR